MSRIRLTSGLAATLLATLCAEHAAAQGCIPLPEHLTAAGGLEDITDPLTPEFVIVRFDGDGTNHFYADRSTGANYGQYADGHANYVTAYAEGYLWAELGGRAIASSEQSAMLLHRFQTRCIPFPDHAAPPNGLAQHLLISANYLRYLVKGDGPAEKRISIRTFVADINGFTTLAEGDYEHPTLLDDVLTFAAEGGGVLSDGIIPQVDIQFSAAPHPTTQDVLIGGIGRGTYAGQVIEFEFLDRGEADLKEYQYIQWMSADLLETSCHDVAIDRFEAAEVEAFATVDSDPNMSDYSYLQFEAKAGTESYIFQQPVLTCFSTTFNAQLILNKPWVLDPPEGWRRGGALVDPIPPSLPGASITGLDRKVTPLPDPNHNAGRGAAAFHVNVYSDAPTQGTRAVYFDLTGAAGVAASEGLGTIRRFDKEEEAPVTFDPSQPLQLGVGYWEVTIPLRIFATGFVTIGASFDPNFPADETAYCGVESIGLPFTVADWRLLAHAKPELTDLTVQRSGAGDSFVYFVPLRESRWKGLPPMTMSGFTITSEDDKVDWILKPGVHFDKERDAWFISAYPAEAVDIDVHVHIGEHSLTVPISFSKEALIKDPSTPGQGF